MFCCFDFSSSDEATTSRLHTSYPGQRPLIKTAGNALMEAPAPSSPEMVSVTVPNGVTAGDTIRVDSPDGRRAVEAVVPAGMSPGKMFTVRFPPEAKSPSTASQVSSVVGEHDTPGFAYSLDNFIAQSEVHATPVGPAQSVNTSPAGGYHTTVEARQEDATSHGQTQGGFADSIDELLVQESSNQPKKKTPRQADQQPQKEIQRFMNVNVPPGTSAGSTLHVEVPGENRTLAVTVPPGVSTFRVAYAPTPPPVQSFQNSRQSIGQKLLLVKVPAGTAPGATLHVAVPDEPGRILSAKVPGNVSQFHVAYEPRTIDVQPVQPIMQGGIANAPPSMNPAYQHQQQTYYSQANTGSMQQATPYNNNYQQQRPHNNSSGGGMGNYILPAVGAAALGAAAYATYDHFSHNNYDNGGTDDDGAGDVDVDMGDFDF